MKISMEVTQRFSQQRIFPVLNVSRWGGSGWYSKSISNGLYQVKVRGYDWPFHLMNSSISRNPFARRAVQANVSRNQRQLPPLKCEHWASRAHRYTSKQSVSLFERHGVCALIQHDYQSTIGIFILNVRAVFLKL
ncbi:hypothetical protein TNCV_962861 [Trichonephila clavipes]|nr:hypothetical protein TNCV_962861 [Trichonephila clavipes]